MSACEGTTRLAAYTCLDMHAYLIPESSAGAE
jgi:hypothetical protein